MRKKFLQPTSHFLTHFPLLITSLLLIFSLQAFGQEKDLTINAHTLNYSDDGKVVEAEGSVEVYYKDLSARGEKLYYYTSDKRIYSNSGFELNYQSLKFSGATINFNIKERYGDAQDVKLLYRNVVLTGKVVNIDKDRIELTDAEFTTCDLSLTHYHFYAKKITLYPDDGWLICAWGIFFLDDIPTMPVPIYIYDVRAEEKGLTHTIPYPQFGSNDWDGNYVLQGFPWHLSRSLNGNLSLSYSEKKGLGSGVDLRYTINEQNSGIFTVYSKARDPILSVLEHKYQFGSKMARTGVFDFQIFKMPDFRQFELLTKISLNEIVNYEKVSMLPLLTLVLKKASLRGIDISGHIQGGFITEESTGQGLYLGGLKLDISVPVWGGRLGTITPAVNNELTYYSNNTRWIKSTAGLKLSKNWSDFFSTEIGYKHFLLNSGTSPYNFELYRFSSSNQVSGAFLLGWDSSKFGINAIYNLPYFTPQEFDYIIRAGIHCFNVTITYRALRQIFNFSFGIN